MRLVLQQAQSQSGSSINQAPKYPKYGKDMILASPLFSHRAVLVHRAVTDQFDRTGNFLIPRLLLLTTVTGY